MSRRWSVMLAAYPLTLVGLIYAISLLPIVQLRLARVRDYGGNPLSISRVGLFFVPEDRLIGIMGPWAWAPQLVFVGLLAVLVYLTGRVVTRSMGCGWIALILMGVVMLVGGLVDVAGWAIETWRLVSSSSYGYWNPEASVLGLWLGLQVGLAVLVVCLLLRWVSAVLGRSSEVSEDSSTKPCVGDVPKRATTLATLGVLPVLLAAFIGGIDRYFGGEDLDLSAFIFYLKLRVSAPPNTSFGYAPNFGYTPSLTSSEQWLTRAAIAAIFILLLWFVLRSMVARWDLPGPALRAALVVAVWGMTVVIGTVIGSLDFAAASALSHDEFGSGGYSLYVLDGMRFGVVWGWLVGGVVFLAYHRTRLPTPALP